jgi:hypothetical protein
MGNSSDSFSPGLRNRFVLLRNFKGSIMNASYASIRECGFDWRPEVYRGRKCRAAILLSIATLMAFAAMLSPSSGKDKNIEVIIREMLPTPFRCSRTTEPALQCRHDDATAARTIVLELVSSIEGPSASLTHDYDDATRHEFLALVRAFFTRIGVAAGVFDDCISQAQWQPKQFVTNGYQLLCYRVELGHRVTHEILAKFPDGTPLLANASEIAR